MLFDVIVLSWLFNQNVTTTGYTADLGNTNNK